MPTIKIEHLDTMLGGEIKRLAVEGDIGYRIDCYFEFIESWLKALGFNSDVIDDYIVEWAEEIERNRS